MLTLSILFLLAALGWGFIVVMANMMSDNPSQGFEGGWSVLFLFLASAAFFAAWWFGFHFV